MKIGGEYWYTKKKWPQFGTSQAWMSARLRLLTMCIGYLEKTDKKRNPASFHLSFDREKEAFDITTKELQVKWNMHNNIKMPIIRVPRFFLSLTNISLNVSFDSESSVKKEN